MPLVAPLPTSTTPAPPLKYIPDECPVGLMAYSPEIPRPMLWSVTPPQVVRAKLACGSHISLPVDRNPTRTSTGVRISIPPLTLLGLA